MCGVCYINWIFDFPKILCSLTHILSLSLIWLVFEDVCFRIKWNKRIGASNQHSTEKKKYILDKRRIQKRKRGTQRKNQALTSWLLNIKLYSGKIHVMYRPFSVSKCERIYHSHYNNNSFSQHYIIFFFFLFSCFLLPFRFFSSLNVFDLYLVLFSCSS